MMPADGVPNAPESAIIVPVPEAEPIVGRLRERFDPSAQLGVPAHITLLYPFIAPDQITEGIVAQLRTFAAKCSSFDYRLHSTGRFANALYLAPDPPQPFVSLVEGLIEHFPDYPPYRGRFASMIPHLTVAVGDRTLIDGLDSELRSDVLSGGSIHASCSVIVLIEKTSGLWRERGRFPLAPGARERSFSEDMSRSILDEAHIHPAIRQKIATNHADIVREVQAAIAANNVVVVGMAQNPHVKKACRTLDAGGIGYKYLEYGSYLNNWRRRNALKMWTGWPTFPMVFVKGVLVGGARDLQVLIDSGELRKMLASRA